MIFLCRPPFHFLKGTFYQKGLCFRYEVPTTDVDHPEIVIMPLYLREKKGGSTNYAPTQLFGQPLLIGLPKANLTYEILYDKVQASLSR